MEEGKDRSERIDDLLRRVVRSIVDREPPAPKMWEALRKRIEGERRS